MIPTAATRIVEIQDAGRRVAAAEVATDGPGVVRAALRVESGHVPAGCRTRLVDAVLDLPEVQASLRLEAAVPIGDTEMLERLRDRCEHLSTRPAGATCLVDADPPHRGSPAHRDVRPRAHRHSRVPLAS